MKSLLLAFLLVAYVTNTIAQDIFRVHSYLDTLCAPGMSGRGYINNGEKVAALYLEDRFKELGLDPFSSLKKQEHPYFQYFTLNINTFPGAMQFATDKVTLTPGNDFILSPSSGEGKGTAKVKFLDTLIFSQDKAQKKFLKLHTQKLALVYPQKFSKQIQKLPESLQRKIEKSVCIIKLQDQKLTASLAGSQVDHPEFEIRKECFPETIKRVTFNVDAVVKENYETQNVIGYIKGTEYPDSFVVISAHYDHLGKMGPIYFPGANDNASGVSLLLEFADYFRQHTPKFSVVFIAFGGEEAGLIGSAWYTNHPIFPLKDIRFLLNLDLLGTGEEGITVVNATRHLNEFNLLNTINEEDKYLPSIKKRGTAANSDHYFFELKGVPTFFIYTMGGINAYHDIQDKKETLPLTKFSEVFKLLIKFIDKL